MSSQPRKASHIPAMCASLGAAQHEHERDGSELARARNTVQPRDFGVLASQYADLLIIAPDLPAQSMHLIQQSGDCLSQKFRECRNRSLSERPGDRLGQARASRASLVGYFARRFPKAFLASGIVSARMAIFARAPVMQ